MSTHTTRAATLAFCLAAFLAVPATGQGVHTQTFELQPGWSSIFVEVMPEPADFETVFAGVPVESVWGWFPPMGEVEFVEDPAEGLLQLGGWRGYFPRPRPESLLTNLFAFEPNRAYLIHLEGAAPVTITISGKPVIIPLTWTPNSFNLVGFHVDPASPPSFGAFLAAAEAHADQPIYQLDPAGFWRLVDQPFSTAIRSGEAYWVWSDGPSSFQGPLEVEIDAFDGLDFSAGPNELRLVARNNAVVGTNVRVRSLAAPAPVPLHVKTVDDLFGSARYPELPPAYTLTAEPGQELFIDLGVRRAEMTADRCEQLLEVTDGIGSRWLVFVGATRVQPAAPLQIARPGASKGFRAKMAAKAGADPFAGLWIGNALVRKVSEAQRAGVEPMPTSDDFALRLLIHVDGGGQARLLKEAIQMWQDGTRAPAPDDPGFFVVDQPGRYVLVTCDERIPDFEGATLRDGVGVGLRFSTVAYDYPEDPARHCGVEMSGTFDPTGTLSVTLAMAADFRTNPYKHKYHPDHDNLDSQFLNPQTEAYDITRTIGLRFSSVPPGGSEREPPEWGDSFVGGTYLEEIEGLHRNRIFVEGDFLLQRIAATTELNQ